MKGTYTVLNEYLNTNASGYIYIYVLISFHQFKRGYTNLISILDPSSHDFCKLLQT